MSKGDTIFNASIGAVITVIFGFTGVSALLGGGIAGFLQREESRIGARTGAISGAIASLPFALVLGFGMTFFFGIPSARLGFPDGLEIVIILLLVVPLIFLWNIGLGAAGGYIGGYLQKES